jgi:hypothetical protein
MASPVRSHEYFELELPGIGAPPDSSRYNRSHESKEPKFAVPSGDSTFRKKGRSAALAFGFEKL